MSDAVFRYRIKDGILIIYDMDGPVSVTNDAEKVLRRIQKEITELPNMVIYRDTDQQFDQLRWTVNDGQYSVEFFVLGLATEDAAIAAVKAQS